MNHKLINQRRQHGWSQAELARAAGVHQTMISKVEAGQICPSTEVAQAIASALGVQVKDVFTVALVEVIVSPEPAHA